MEANKTLFATLEEIKKTLEGRIENRKNMLAECTEKQQNSKRGKFYKKKTQVLQEVLDNLYITTDSMKELMEY